MDEICKFVSCLRMGEVLFFFFTPVSVLWLSLFEPLNEPKLFWILPFSEYLTILVSALSILSVDVLEIWRTLHRTKNGPAFPRFIICGLCQTQTVIWKGQRFCKRFKSSHKRKIHLDRRNLKTGK